MARSRFSAVLKRVRLWVTGKAESERRDPLGHQFNAEARPAGFLSHQFGIGSGDQAPVGHSFDVAGINVRGNVGHEFHVTPIDWQTPVGHQFNVSYIDTAKSISHRFGVEFPDLSAVSHTFSGRLAASSTIYHEFGIPFINGRAPLHHEFNIHYVDGEKVLGHRFGVETVDLSTVGHTFLATQAGSGEVFHSVEVNEINSRAVVAHRFFVENINVESILSHAFGVQNDVHSPVGHQFLATQYATEVLGHTFTVPAIETDSILFHQFNIDRVDSYRTIGHSFGVEDTDTSVIGHQFLGGLAGVSSLGNQFNVSGIRVSGPVGHEFTVHYIDGKRVLPHQFAVQQDTSNVLSHKYGVHKPTTGVVGHSVDVNNINASGDISHQFNIHYIDSSAPLGHSFGHQRDDLAVVGHKFGYETPNSGVTSHQFSVYGIFDREPIGHQVNIDQILGKFSSVSHQFSFSKDDERVLGHNFKLAYNDSLSLTHSFSLDEVNTSTLIGHQFNMNRGRRALGHSFSAIGTGIIHKPLSHQFNADFILPPDRTGHSFYVSIQLDVPSVTISGIFKYLPEESTLYPFDIIAHQVTRTEHLSYASPHNTASSIGTWAGIDPDEVIPEKKSGLSEADYFLGSFVFGNEPENLVSYTDNLKSGARAIWPEYESDTEFLFQSWNSPVTTEGYGAWWNINDFPIRLTDFNVLQGENPFPPFFGRQITISGDLREFVTALGAGDYPEGMDINDPYRVIAGGDIEYQRDPLLFNEYDHSGVVNLILERSFTISGIYVTQPNGEPGSDLRPRGTEVRVGFTYEESNIQPEILMWELGVNEPGDTYTYKEETDQWIYQGRYRDFTVPSLQNGDNVCGRITVHSPAKLTEFTGTIPDEIIQQKIDDKVRAYGAGIFIWPDIEDEIFILELCVRLFQTRRERLPSGLTIRYEGLNSEGKVIKFSRVDGELQATYIRMPSNLLHDERKDSLLINRSVPATQVINSNTLSTEAITTYRLDGQNSSNRILIIDEEPN